MRMKMGFNAGAVVLAVSIATAVSGAPPSSDDAPSKTTVVAPALITTPVVAAVNPQIVATQGASSASPPASVTVSNMDKAAPLGRPQFGRQYLAFKTDTSLVRAP